MIQLDSTNLKGMKYFGVLERLREELDGVLGRPVHVVDALGLKDPLPDQVLKEAVSL